MTSNIQLNIRTENDNNFRRSPRIFPLVTRAHLFSSTSLLRRHHYTSDNNNKYPASHLTITLLLLCASPPSRTKPSSLPFTSFPSANPLLPLLLRRPACDPHFPLHCPHHRPGRCPDWNCHPSTVHRRRSPRRCSRRPRHRKLSSPMHQQKRRPRCL